MPTIYLLCSTGQLKDVKSNSVGLKGRTLLKQEMQQEDKSWNSCNKLLRQQAGLVQTLEVKSTKGILKHPSSWPFYRGNYEIFPNSYPSDDVHCAGQ